MATPVKTSEGTWRIQISAAGVRESATLPTKREALAWALARKAELKNGGTSKTLNDVLATYSEQVSEHHRGWAKEQIRLAAFPKQDKFPGKVLLSQLKPVDIAAWRDERLAVNSRGTVLRDLGLLSAVLEHARREWQWIATNPVRDVKKPAEPDHRTRLISGPEVRKMLRQLGYAPGRPKTVSQAVAMAFLMALSTGMRAGEICGLTWDRVHADFVWLDVTKTKPRDVPLSPVARKIIGWLRGWDDVTVFGLKSQSLDALFRKARARAGLSGFLFHDARHSAATRIARSRRVDVLYLCKIFGWTNPKMAMVYVNPTAADIAKLL